MKVVLSIYFVLKINEKYSNKSGSSHTEDSSVEETSTVKPHSETHSSRYNPAPDTNNKS